MKPDNLTPKTPGGVFVAGRSAVGAALPDWPGPRTAPDAYDPFLATALDILGDPGPVRPGPMPSALRRFTGDLVLVAEAAGSQYDALRGALSAAGPPARPLAAVALAGHGFHGQHGRGWTTLPGNLHLAAIFPCDLAAADWGPVLPALPAVALCDAVADLVAGRVRPGIKWVNDIVCGGAKVAGTLTAGRAVDGRLQALMLGVGLNLVAAPAGPPEGGQGLPATSLRAVTPGAAGVGDLGQALAVVLDELAAGVADLARLGPAGLAAAYRERSVVVGRTGTLWPEEADAGDAPLWRGRIAGLGDDLALLPADGGAPLRSGRLVLDPVAGIGPVAAG